MENASKEFNYEVHILNTNISENIKQEILKLNDDNGNFKIDFSDVTKYLDSVADKFPVRDYYSKTTYFRLFLPELYPQYDKVLYLDSDIVILSDIAELYNIDMGDNLIVGTPDGAVQNIPIFQEYVEKVVGVIDFNNYFNAGILVMNLEELRKYKFQEKFLYLLEKISNIEIILDQQILFIILVDMLIIINSHLNYGGVKIFLILMIMIQYQIEH